MADMNDDNSHNETATSLDREPPTVTSGGTTTGSVAPAAAEATAAPPEPDEGLEYKFHPLANRFPLATDEEFKNLIDSIQRDGLLQPIVLLDNMVLDGRNRLRAAHAAGVKPRFEEWKPTEGFSAARYVWTVGAERRNLAPKQRAAIYLLFKPDFDHESQRLKENANRSRSAKAKAQPRTGDGKRLAGRPAGDAPPAAKKRTPNRAAALVGAEAGTSAATVERVKRASNGDPGVLKQIAADPKFSLKKATRDVKERKAAEAAKSAPEADSSTEQFDVIVVDAPRDGEADNKTLANLKLPPTAANALLFIWTTAAALPDVLKLAGKWGFEPRAVLPWVQGKVSTEDLLSGQIELCLVCVKGEPTVMLRKKQLIVIHGRAPASSRKPSEFYKLVEDLSPKGRKVEVSAQRVRKGWNVWPDVKAEKAGKEA